MSIASLSILGDKTEAEFIAQMIRVNQAGEYGAKRIYAGQLAVLKNKTSSSVIQHMAEQEEQHLQTFNQMMVERQVRPTVLQPLWHLAGFALGAGTALFGEKAAMACTVAVEEVIDEHYESQLQQLDDTEQSLKDVIKKFQAEELEHRDTGLAYGAEAAIAYPVLCQGIKMASRVAIWLSTRI